jgi:hypothetical protein
MKKILILLIAFLFSGCQFVNENIASWDEVEFYQIKPLNEADPSYYFQYPKRAKVEFSGENGTLIYNECKVFFGKNLNVIKSEDYDVIREKDKNIGFESWFFENALVLYSALLNDYGYYFWLYDEEKDVSSCMDMVDFIVYSFTNKPFYINEKYSYRVNLLSDYKLDYLANESGILQKKWIEEPNEKNVVEGYKVEIVLSAEENLLDKADVYEVVKERYSGYSMEFFGDGVFVDEMILDNSISHYFVMSSDKNVILEANITVPKKKYSLYKESFNEFVSTIEFF